MVWAISHSVILPSDLNIENRRQIECFIAKIKTNEFHNIFLSSKFLLKIKTNANLNFQIFAHFPINYIVKYILKWILLNSSFFSLNFSHFFKIIKFYKLQITTQNYFNYTLGFLISFKRHHFKQFLFIQILFF